MNILKLLFCIVFVNFAYGQGDAPPLLQGQYQSTKAVGSFIQSPNKQTTKISGATALIETGNKNILENPSFEHSIFNTGWVNLNGTLIKDITNVIDGKSASKVTLSSEILDLSQDSDLYQNQFSDNTTAIFTCRVKTSVSGVKACPKKAGIIQSALCKTHTGSNKWELLKSEFILGSVSNGVAIVSDSPVTGDVIVDDCFLGAVDGKGENNTASNIGTGFGLFAQKSLSDLQFKSIKAGTNV